MVLTPIKFIHIMVLVVSKPLRVVEIPLVPFFFFLNVVCLVLPPAWSNIRHTLKLLCKNELSLFWCKIGHQKVFFLNIEGPH
jgi:hypothetical protein